MYDKRSLLVHVPGSFKKHMSSLILYHNVMNEYTSYICDICVSTSKDRTSRILLLRGICGTNDAQVRYGSQNRTFRKP